MKYWHPRETAKRALVCKVVMYFEGDQAIFSSISDVQLIKIIDYGQCRGEVRSEKGAPDELRGTDA